MKKMLKIQKMGEETRKIVKKKIQTKEEKKKEIKKHILKMRFLIWEWIVLLKKYLFLLKK
jgi:hypothetical protein